MFDNEDNTGEEVELDPVLDDDEDFQDTDFDEDEDSGQNDSDEVNDEEDTDEDLGEEGEDTDEGDNAEQSSEETEGETQAEETDKAQAKKPLSKEENAANAARRRKEELEARLKEEHTKTVIDVLGGKNPFTGKEMTDAHDVEVYERMKRIEKNGGDPVADYASTLAEERRQAERAEKSAQNTDFNSWAKKDAANFAKANPDVDMQSLFKDATFTKIAEPLLKQRVPMSNIYALFQETKANIDSVNRKAKEKVKEALAGEIANKNASAGSLKANGEKQTSLYTREQLANMSEDEIEANWDKVERSYEALGKKK